MGSDNSRIIEETTAYIYSHISEHLELEKLASRFYISKYHYHRIFKESIGQNISEYIRSRRIIKAASELVQTEMSVKEISRNNGYYSHSAFSRAFKRKFGISPIKYRDNHK